MGIFRDINNRKRSDKERHARRFKRQEKAAKKAANPAPVNIEDPELFSNEMLKNKLRNPRNNIQLSGRNRKKQLKRLKYAMRDEQKKAQAEEKESAFVKDFFMDDADEANEADAPAETEMADEVASSSKSSEPSSSGTAAATKKKKRGGRKKKKGKDDSGDVEMEEL